MRVRIRGKVWDLVFTRLNDNDDGACDPPFASGKKIRIKSRLRGERKLDVLLHELLHAAYWDMDEGAIEEAASDIARVLWKLGYRETNQDQ